ncbi:hypothetical protein B0H14DRAFT_2512163 [Mycena olivaceomarginata]|nr:hypothetical protein B0H14DRAFT_2512163 [Mycena olivaceomarginata]
MPQIGLDVACFLGCILESLGLGVLTVMASFTLRIILKKKQVSTRRGVLIILVLIWVLSAMHWIINVHRAYQAFLVFPDGPVMFYNTLNLPSYTAKNAVYTTLTVVADSFATYRCYVVWNRNRYIGAIPAMLLAGTAVAGYGATVVFTTIEPGNPIFFTALVPWITAWITLTLATNVVCTCPPIHRMVLSSPLTLLVSGLIAYRIVSTARAVRGVRMGRDRLMSTLVVIVESASIYSSTLVALIASYLSGNNGQFVVIDVVRGLQPLLGITFTMIIMRVSLGISSTGQTFLSTTTMNTDSTRLPVGHGEIAVNVTRLVEVNQDDYSRFSAKNSNTERGNELFHA